MPAPFETKESPVRLTCDKQPSGLQTELRYGMLAVSTQIPHADAIRLRDWLLECYPLPDAEPR
jgi:hypothetical protein